MAGDLTLKVLIQTIADNKGIKATEAEVDKLVESLEKASSASGGARVSTEQIVEALKKSGQASQEAAKSTDIFSKALEKVEKEGSGVTDEMRRQAQEWERLRVDSEKSGKSAESLAKNVNSVKGAFGGLKDIISGGLNGNLLQIGEGFGKISKATVEASGSVRNLFAQIARGGAIGAVIAGPIIVAIEAVKMRTRDLEKQMEKIWADAAKSREAYAAAVEANSARVAKALELELKAIEKINAAYERREKQIEQANKRADTLTPAQRDLRDTQLDIEEKKALAGAQSDEQRERIKADYARRREVTKVQDKLADFGTADNRDNIQIGAAQEAQAAARQKNDEIEETVRQAQKQFDAAMQTLNAFKPGKSAGTYDWEKMSPAEVNNLSPQAQAARTAAFAARDNLKKVKDKADTEYAETSKIIASAQAQIDAANLQKEETELRRQAYRAMIAQSAKDKSSPTATADDQKTAAALNKALTSQDSPTTTKPGMILGEMTTADGRKVLVNREATGTGITRNGQPVVTKTMEKEIAAAGEAIGLTLRAFGAFAQGVTDESKKTSETLRRQAERSGGG